MNKKLELYQVDRATYSDFVHHIKNGSCDVQQWELGGESHSALRSKNHNITYCERISSENSKERYYVYDFDIRESDWCDYQPHPTVTLTSSEQVQKFFDYIKEQNNK